MELKKEGKIKSKDDANSIDAELDAADDDDQRTAEEVAMAKLRSQRESMRNNPVSDAYADKIKSKLGGGVGSSNKGAGAGRVQRRKRRRRWVDPHRTRTNKVEMPPHLEI